MNHAAHVLLFQRLTRRSFLNHSAKSLLAASIASVLPIPFMKRAEADTIKPALEEIKHSACLVNCGSRCPLKVIVKNDHLVRIEPESSPNDKVFGQHQIRPCLRGRSSRWRVYSPDRLKYPLVRIGKRGEGKFKRVSWDEATKLIADRLKKTIDKYGNDAVYYNYQSGAYYHTQGTPAWQRLLNLLGGYLRYHNTYSTAQISTATPYTFGEYYASHFDQIKHADLVVFFGMNLAETRMSGGGQVEECRRALAQSQAKVIIIDPRRTDSVIAHHATWIPIKPTTDSALVAGIVHTLIVENRINEETVNRYCLGYDKKTLPDSAPENGSYKDYILGSGDDNTPKTAEWAAQITGIPAAQIRQLARDIANAKTCYIAQGWGPQRHANGEQSVRAIQILPILTGHFGLPGTNIGNWPYATAYGVPKLPSGDNPVKTSIPCYLWTEAIHNPQAMTDKTHGIRGAEKLKTGIKFLLNQAGNILINQHGQINRTTSILADESACETIVVIDNHMTPSAKYADILLPETSYLESEDLVDSAYASGAHYYLIAMQKAVTPLWECRSTYDICADIATHFGLRNAFTTGLTQSEWCQKHYEMIKSKRHYLPDWSLAKHQGVIDQQVATESESIALLNFRRDPALFPLKTPSGKIEIYSERLAIIAKEWILPDGDQILPIPAFYPAWESHLDTEMTKKYPLQLIGFHTKGHAHSTYANVPQLHEAVPDELWMNPIDAAKRRIASGQRVHIYNDRGIVEMPVKVTPRILPGVVAMPQGAWVNFNPSGVDIGGCINTLTSHRTSPLAKGNPQHTNLVDVKQV